MRIREDIIAQRFFSAPHADDLIELFQKQIDESVKDEEEYFTKEEESKLSQKLEALQKRVSELEEKYNLEKEKANEVKDAISSSKSDINIYPKGIWYRTSANKIINALKLAFKNKEVKAMLLEVTKEYILKMIGINK